MKTSLPFVKYSGNGNDFVILDRPESQPSSELIQKICDRFFGVGADGVLILSDVEGADGRMRIFNADGGEAEMCANGLRCLAQYVDDTIPQKKNHYLIKTMNGLYPIQKRGSSLEIEMSEIKDKNAVVIEDHPFRKSFYVNTGVPHMVFLVEDALAFNIKEIGSKYRHHPAFPNGSNIDFVQKLHGDKKAYVRTYERGVEDETFSCGTGLTATALALAEWFGWSGEIHLQNKGGKQVVRIEDKVYYSGEITYCFKGEFPL